MTRRIAILRSFLGRSIRFGDGIGAPVALGFLALTSILVVLGYRSLGAGGWKGYTTVAMEPGEMLHEDRHAYEILLVIPDSDSVANSSSLEIYEDGRVLGPAHTAHEEIRERGAGRYSHWTNGVYFSAIDNSDPRTNGRRYSLRYGSRGPAVAVRHRAAIFFAFSFVACVLLNAGRLGRLKQRVGRLLPIPPGWMYGAGLAVVLIGALLCRVSRIRVLQFPVITPDSLSFLTPALESSGFPLSEPRPIAFPYMISLALVIFRHPVGILILNGCLALLTTSLLAVVLWRRFGTGVASLLVAVYVLFCAKNLAFEHMLMAEHLARNLYLIFLVVLLGFWKPTSHRATALLALVSVAAILTKPSALILFPIFVGWLVVAARTQAERPRSRRLLQTVGIYFGVSGCLLAAYASVNYARFGFFGISGMDGFSLYWHVHPLTRLDSGRYPEIKSQLKTFFPAYLTKYVARGDYRGDWVLWGGASADLQKDFGAASPAAVIRAYSENHGQGSLFRRQNAIFKDLALEAIRYRPRDYLMMSLNGVSYLFDSGLNFWYWQEVVIDSSVTRDRSAVWFRHWFSVFHSPWSASVYDPNRRLSRWSLAMVVPDLISTVMTRWFKAIAWCGVLFGVIAISAVDGTRQTVSRLIGLLPFAAVAALYIVFCGFIVPAEPPRYLAHVQDLIVTVPLILIGIGIGTVFGLAKPDGGSDRSRAASVNRR